VTPPSAAKRLHYFFGIMRSASKIKITKNTIYVPGQIITGDNTHNQDQDMAPVSFKPINKTVSNVVKNCINGFKLRLIFIDFESALQIIFQRLDYYSVGGFWTFFTEYAAKSVVTGRLSHHEGVLQGEAY